jgi:hypothetical protein
MFRKIVLTVLVLGLMSGVSFAGGVQSDNSGNAGYLFVATGENHGKDSIGVWTDPSFLQGEQGIQGVAGQDGYTPIKGVDYNDGANGQDGLNGKDVDPATVEKLEKSIQQNTNATNNLNTRVNKLEETQNIIGGVLRIKDTKKWSVDLFIDYSTNRQMIDRQGIRFTYKMGESYQDKENKRLEARIQALENK